MNNPIVCKGIIGTHKWGLYWRETHTLIGEYPNQNNALEARMKLLEAIK